MPLPDRIHPSLLRIFQRSTPDDTIAFVDESYVAPEEDFSESFYILVVTAIKFEHLASCQMRVFGTGVLGTRYCRVPGSWYRAEGCVGPDR